MSAGLDLHEINDSHDRQIIPFLRLIEQSFPPEEMMPPSFWAQLFHDKSSGQSSGCHILVLKSDAPDKAARGLMMYYHAPGDNAAVLWYLAVEESERGKGIGTTLLNNLILRLSSEPTCRAILFEIERPDQARNSDHLKQILDRERFYHRWGARIARNIEYKQSVGSWQPTTPMYLCIYRIDKTLNDNEASNLFIEHFGGTGESGIQSMPEHLVLD